MLQFNIPSHVWCFVTRITLSRLSTLAYCIICYQPIWYIIVFTFFHYVYAQPKTKEVVSFVLSIDKSLQAFVILFLFRYVRLIVNLASSWCYRTTPIPGSPKLCAQDVTVIVPTVQPYGKEFEECIQSIYTNRPAQVIVVTAGEGSNISKAAKNCEQYPTVVPFATEAQNKRKQLCRALQLVRLKKNIKNLQLPNKRESRRT